jgi:hypothetical protein
VPDSWGMRLHFTTSWLSPDMLPPAVYKRALRDSAFTLTPLGVEPPYDRTSGFPINVSVVNLIPNHRAFEALSSGSVPVFVREFAREFRWPEIGFCPCPVLESWDELPSRLEFYAAHPNALDALQMDVLSWWQSFQDAAVHRMRDAVLGNGTGYTLVGRQPDEDKAWLNELAHAWKGEQWEPRSPSHHQPPPAAYLA